MVCSLRRFSGHLLVLSGIRERFTYGRGIQEPSARFPAERRDQRSHHQPIVYLDVVRHHWNGHLYSTEPLRTGRLDVLEVAWRWGCCYHAILGSKNKLRYHEYSIGVSRLVYAPARDGGMPSSLTRLNKHAAPGRALLVLFAGSAMTLVMIVLVGAKLDQLFLFSGAGFTALYILGSGTAVRLLKLRGLKRIFPYVTLAASIAVFAFVGLYALFPLAKAVLSLLWIRGKARVSGMVGAAGFEPATSRAQAENLRPC